MDGTLIAWSCRRIRCPPLGKAGMLAGSSMVSAKLCSARRQEREGSPVMLTEYFGLGRLAGSMLKRRVTGRNAEPSNRTFRSREERNGQLRRCSGSNVERGNSPVCSWHESRVIRQRVDGVPLMEKSEETSQSVALDLSVIAPFGCDHGENGLGTPLRTFCATSDRTVVITKGCRPRTRSGDPCAQMAGAACGQIHGHGYGQ